ncbi:MAG: DNA recombination protein RmuC, partial [Defluviitaleaceae bacterium]|nr:DNA recombination protein RmuC [Defluviitaleaceae bacterium]
KTLQIQKNAVEIEKTLGAVKLEFENFAGVLDKTQKKIGEASQELEKLVGTRTNKINSSLKNIQVYTGDDVTKLLE